MTEQTIAAQEQNRSPTDGKSALNDGLAAEVERLQLVVERCWYAFRSLPSYVFVEDRRDLLSAQMLKNGDVCRDELRRSQIFIKAANKKLTGLPLTESEN